MTGFDGSTGGRAERRPHAGRVLEQPERLLEADADLPGQCEVQDDRSDEHDRASRGANAPGMVEDRTTAKHPAGRRCDGEE